ncbi:hypothetical protein Drose_06080 [Dactylosporangium roseum]|uniref:Uncharacterized protein n=1 Tax=Dactylosporangium roseum TaxID=47989 RepID=A0ABY5Z710_9ACTN|nr:hypothetical protein [Dactylosporangium roseum]UWZ37840.1 hypothetical protein Drose_06080 [Dactylosporangium roseum]
MSTDATPMPEQQTCQRRMTDWGPWERAENLDHWADSGHGLVGQAQAGRSCSFCGSLHPDDFMRLVAEGWIVGPTDKAYKAYFARPYSAAELAERRARWEANDPTVRAVRELGERDGKTAEQIAADIEQIAEVALGSSRGETVAKFYFQHFSTDQRAEFIDLYNSGRMKVEGGGFYVLPFFCEARPGPATPTPA